MVMNGYIETIIVVVVVLTILCCCCKCLIRLCCQRSNDTAVNRIIQRNSTSYNVNSRFDNSNNFRHHLQFTRLSAPLIRPVHPFFEYHYGNRNNIDADSRYDNTNNFRQSAFHSPQFNVSSGTQPPHTQFTTSSASLIRPVNPLSENRYGQRNNTGYYDDHRYDSTQNFRQSAYQPLHFGISSDTRLSHSQFTSPFEQLLRDLRSNFENNYDGYVRPISDNKNALIEELKDSIALSKSKADIESQQVLSKNAKFLDGEKLLLQCENLKSNDIKKGQTKVKLTSKLRNNYVICTVIDYGTNHLELKLRHSTSFLAGQKEMDTFKVTVYPNYKEIEFAEVGYNAISTNTAMLKKLMAYDNDCDNSKTLSCSSKSVLHSIIKTAANTTPTNPLLICAKQNSDLENFVIALKTAAPTLFLQHSVARVVTIHRSNLSLELSTYTKTIEEITNIRLYNIIFCTMGIVPKLIQHKNYGLNDAYFKEIFIVEAQKVSELDCWMVIGHAGNVNTKIYICGTKLKERHRSYNRQDQNFQASTTAVNSMFSRLWRKEPSYSNSNSDFFVYRL